MSGSPREDNRVPALVAKSDADNTPVVLEADPVTKRLKVHTTSNLPELKSVPVTLTATGEVIAGVPGKKLKVYATKIVCSAVMSINFRDGAADDISGSMPMAANGGYIETIAPPAYLFETAIGNSLDLVIIGTGTASGRVSYWEE